MKFSKNKLNYIYNLVYQMLIVLIPLILTPYLSRVLGATGIGDYSYNFSVVNVFMLFSLLGINNYGNRVISSSKSDKTSMSNNFWSIYIIQIFLTLLMIIVYTLYLWIFMDFDTIPVIQIIFLFSVIFDVSWFFFGLEEFLLTISRNIIVKIISIVFIFIFVKTSNDLYIYVIIMSSSTLISQMYLFFKMRGRVNCLDIKKIELRKHFKSILILFIPVLAYTIYKIMDKIMLGLYSTYEQVGYYTNAMKIINVPISIISSLGVVMLPRMSNLYSTNKDKRAEQLFYKSIKFMMFLAFPISFGIMFISRDFAPIYFGQEFSKSGEIMLILSSSIIFISWANVIRTQILIPLKLDKIYVISTISGAVLNLILNLVLIKKYAGSGAAISTVLAEFLVAFMQTMYIRKKYRFFKNFKFYIWIIATSIFMITVSYLLTRTLNDNIYKIIFQVCIAVVVYGMLNLKYILTISNMKEWILKWIKKH